MLIEEGWPAFHMLPTQPALLNVKDADNQRICYLLCLQQFVNDNLKCMEFANNARTTFKMKGVGKNVRTLST
jgi:hypothetical protein